MGRKSGRKVKPPANGKPAMRSDNLTTTELAAALVAGLGAKPDAALAAKLNGDVAAKLPADKIEQALAGVQVDSAAVEQVLKRRIEPDGMVSGSPTALRVFDALDDAALIEAAHDVAKKLAGHFHRLFTAVHDERATFRQKVACLDALLDDDVSDGIDALDVAVKKRKVFPPRKDGTADVIGPNMHAALLMLAFIVADDVNEKCACDDTDPAAVRRHREAGLRSVLDYLASLSPFDYPSVLGGLMTDRELALERLATRGVNVPTFTAGAPPTPLGEANHERATHSIDFRSVDWYGTPYTFTGPQAACVKALWEALEQRTPELGGETLLEFADSESGRLDLVFRNHAAWGKMIVPGTRRGNYRLNPPAK